MFEDNSAIYNNTELNIQLPVIKITEAWGKAGTKDREIIEKFTSRVPGKTIGDKIQAINAILTGKKEKANISDILSAMVVAEILFQILNEFTESAGGFLFEGFLAGLFGGKSVQIVKPEDIEGMDAAGKPITVGS